MPIAVIFFYIQVVENDYWKKGSDIALESLKQNL
jgi:hypothetical protein